MTNLSAPHFNVGIGIEQKMIPTSSTFKGLSQPLQEESMDLIKVTLTELIDDWFEVSSDGQIFKSCMIQIVHVDFQHVLETKAVFLYYDDMIQGVTCS